MLTKLKEVSERLIIGGLLCSAIGWFYVLFVEMFGIYRLLDNSHMMFGNSIVIGVSCFTIGVILRIIYNIIRLIRKH